MPRDRVEYTTGDLDMSRSQHILYSFESLPEAERREVAAEIIRRTINLDLPPLTDEELALNAEELFLDLDERESNN